MKNARPVSAVFNSKAVIQDVTDPLNIIPIDGNAALQVVLTDRGEKGATGDPSTADSIGITVLSKDGGLWFSSNWSGVRTIEQMIDGGNLQVR